MEVSEAEAASLKEQSTLATTDALTRILEVLADAELRLRDAASKKILLEVTLLRAIEARNAMSIDAVLKQLNALRGQGGAVAAVAPASSVAADVNRRVSPPITAPPQPVAPSPIKSASTDFGSNTSSEAPVAAPATPRPQTPAADSGVTGDALETLWAQVMEGVARVSKFAANYLISAHPVSFVKGVFTIGYDPEFSDQIGLADNSKNHAILQTKLSELGHPNSQIKFIVAEAPEGRARPVFPVAPPTPAPTAQSRPVAAPGVRPAATAAKEKAPAPVPFNKDDFKNDPLIQKALEVFKGQIVEVRG
jgi:DNA polymerase-3 subunit gamma/tau